MRNSGETYEYKFIEIKFITISGEEYLTGRLLARMYLKSRQKYNEASGRRSPSRASLQSDPTTLFFLRLWDHKLILIPEQPRSPKTTTFEFVLKKLLLNDWDHLYNRELSKFKKKLKKERLTKPQRDEFWKKFDKEYPEPSLSLNPIGSPENVQHVLDTFAKVKSLRLTINKTNNEDFALDEEFIKMFGESVQRTNSITASQDYRNNKEGLESESVGNLIRASTETGGNCNFKVSGISTTGENIVRTDEHTKIKPTLEFENEKSDIELAKESVQKLEELIQNDQIRLAAITNPDENKQDAATIKRELG